MNVHTSYWIYCFLHSGVICAPKCSANFMFGFHTHWDQLGKACKIKRTIVWISSLYSIMNFSQSTAKLLPPPAHWSTSASPFYVTWMKLYIIFSTSMAGKNMTLSKHFEEIMNLESWAETVIVCSIFMLLPAVNKRKSFSLVLTLALLNKLSCYSHF